MFLKLLQCLVFGPEIFVPVCLKVICATKTFGDSSLKKKKKNNESAQSSWFWALNIGWPLCRVSQFLTHLGIFPNSPIHCPFLLHLIWFLKIMSTFLLFLGLSSRPLMGVTWALLLVCCMFERVLLMAGASWPDPQHHTVSFIVRCVPISCQTVSKRAN